MGIISWIVFGLIVGLIAKLLTPGRDPGGFFVTALIGIAGSLIGGFIGKALGISGEGKSGAGIVLSVVGAILLLVIYHLAIGDRTRRVV